MPPRIRWPRRPFPAGRTRQAAPPRVDGRPQLGSANGEGSPGMGVTSLLAQLITHASSFQIAYARCVPLEQSFAYGVLRLYAA